MTFKVTSSCKIVISFCTSQTRAICRANILRPSLDCYHGDEHYNLRFILQMEKIRNDRQHSPVLYSLIESLQTLSGHESFQLQLI